jgi:ABC-type sugar transport system ATPase subunit
MLETGFGTFPVAPALKARLLANAQVGSGATKVVCGIRAEDVTTSVAQPVTVAHPVTVAAGAPVTVATHGDRVGTARGVVDLVEPLGSDVYVNVVVGKEMLLARVNPENAPQESEQVEVGLTLSRIHFFDAENGSSLLVAR